LTPGAPLDQVQPCVLESKQDTAQAGGAGRPQLRKVDPRSPPPGVGDDRVRGASPSEWASQPVQMAARSDPHIQRSRAGAIRKRNRGRAHTGCNAICSSPHDDILMARNIAADLVYRFRASVQAGGAHAAARVHCGRIDNTADSSTVKPALALTSRAKALSYQPCSYWHESRVGFSRVNAPL
jgi:hypothetical protein